MRTTATLLALIALLSCLALASAQETPTGLESFFLSTSEPAGWQPATAAQIPLRLRGTFLAGWQKSVSSGPASIYLIGVRRTDPFTIGDASASFVAYLTEKKVQFVQDSKFTVGGRDATKFSFTAPGNGQIVSALSSSAKSDVSTYMEIIIIANGWTDGKGTDLIHFVYATPAAAKDELRSAFKSIVSMSAVKSKFNPTQGEPGGSDEPADDNLVASGTVTPGQAPVLTPGPMMPVSVSVPSGPVSVIPPGTRFLPAVQAGATAIWVAPQHEIGAWYVLIWPGKQSAYVLSGEEYKKLAVVTEGLLVLPFSDNLTVHLNRWDKIWPVAADAQPK